MQIPIKNGAAAAPEQIGFEGREEDEKLWIKLSLGEGSSQTKSNKWVLNFHCLIFERQKATLWKYQRHTCFTISLQCQCQQGQMVQGTDSHDWKPLVGSNPEHLFHLI